MKKVPDHETIRKALLQPHLGGDTGFSGASGWEDEAGVPPNQGAQDLALGIANQEGIEVLNRILAGKIAAQVVVSTKDLNLMDRQVQQMNRTHLENLLGKAPNAKGKYPRPQLKTSYVAPRNPLEQKIADIWQEVLGVEQVGVYDEFYELGGDSVHAVQITTKANQAGLQLSTVNSFEYLTIADIAQFLDDSQGGAHFSGGRNQGENSR